MNINAPGKNANICQSFIYSPSGEPGVVGGIDNGPMVVYDIWGNWSPTFVKDSALTLGFNIDFGYNGASGNPAQTQVTSTSPGVNPGGGSSVGTGSPDSNTWWGAALYAQYKVNKVITLAARGEYIHEDGALNPVFSTGSGVTDTTSGVLGGTTVNTFAQQQVDDFSETLTASFAIWDNLLTRAEYRWDHVTNGSTNPQNVLASGAGRNNVATYQSQNEVSLEAVYSF